MKRLLSIATTALIALSILSTQPTTAKDNACERGYGQDVAECAKQPGSAKACVEAAKARKDSCQCAESCQRVYDVNNARCETVFNVATCGGDFACEEETRENRRICLRIAAETFNTCQDSCL